MFDINPPSGTPLGRIGLYCYGSANCTFDNPTVRIRDTDSDTIADVYDNCPSTANTNQANLDGDSLGDVCDADQDGDGVNGSNGDCDDRLRAGQHGGSLRPAGRTRRRLYPRTPPSGSRTGYCPVRWG